MEHQGALLILHLTSVIRRMKRIAERETSQLFFDLKRHQPCSSRKVGKSVQAKKKAHPLSDGLDQDFRVRDQKAQSHTRVRFVDQTHRSDVL